MLVSALNSPRKGDRSRRQGVCCPKPIQLYFNPQFPEFAAQTMWSLSNAFTSAFKTLDPIPQFKATAKLGAFLAKLRA
jgi:hypothetical protein